MGTTTTSGSPHKLRTPKELMADTSPMPDWFMKGMQGLALAPSAMNQQKYRFSQQDEKPTAVPGTGFYTRVDLGIAKSHFDQASGTDWFRPRMTV